MWEFRCHNVVYTLYVALRTEVINYYLGLSSEARLVAVCTYLISFSIAVVFEDGH